ncbi:entry exclusion lipoprotein TrbK [Halomonas eurihalina]|nr:entry exclusion lipoprotein TrbK [Halomonas eurihalina]MDR5857966.1 entry exclusion lipoprotein TrbK [Halomonas eurihalina]
MMKLKSTVFILFLSTFLLAGCEGGNAEVPEPSREACTGDEYQKIFGEIVNDNARREFEDACRSYQVEEEVREWEFKASPKDDF